MPRRLTFPQRLDRFPPILLRLLVTRGGRADEVPARQRAWTPTDRDLAESCGLTVAELKFVSYSVEWKGPVMAYLLPFLRGCGFDLDNRRCFRRLEWMKRAGRFTHWQTDPVRKAQFEELLQIWEEST